MSTPDLSLGAKAAVQNSPEFLKLFARLAANPYSKTDNAEGIINAGVAINGTIRHLLLDKLNSLDMNFVETDLEYSVPHGTPHLRGEIAGIFNRHFNPAAPVNADDIVVTNGCTSAIEMLTFAMCDPGDHILIPSPLYLALKSDMGTRARAKVTPVHVPLDQITDVAQIGYFEQAIADINSNGEQAKVLFLMVPNNPLGIVYPRNLVRALLQFASKNNLFVVLDEIYALSVFDRSDNTTAFESILSWHDLDLYIDPKSVIVLHGLSKDFGLNGFRLGWVVSPWNKDILKALHAYSPFAFCPAFIDRLITTLFSDHSFIDSMLQVSQIQLAENYKKAAKFLTDHNVSFIPASAGHFVWLQMPIHACIKMLSAAGDNSAVASEIKWTKEYEFDMTSNLLDNHALYMPPGHVFLSNEFGWFRFTFAIEKGELDIALSRLAGAL
ncbi:pyridoxal phosphate-dependent transferase [Coemansia spiralis]|nr:pyridoxal phosphate-dependent transferase [Coemansia spiralis]